MTGNMGLRAHQRRLYYVSQEPCGRGLSEGLDSAGNTPVTPFNNVTVTYSSLPKATGTAADMGSSHTDRPPIIHANVHWNTKVLKIVLRR
jgi:hypothetical protein